MTHIITSLCLRDGACVEVCPVDCIVPGFPDKEWPWYFIDPATCIDCGACVPECPFEAIFPEQDVPDSYEMAADQEQIPFGSNKRIKPGAGVVLDLTKDIQPNYDFFEKGPGYDSKP